MEIKAVVRRYETRNKTAGTELSSSKSRVDWRRTKRELVLLDSSDESSGTSEEEEPTESEDKVDEKDETVVKNSLSVQEEKSHSGEVTEDSEDESIVPGKRKRLNTSVLYDSDESEDSDILVRKVFAKRHCIIDEDESSREQQLDKTCPTENVSTDRKQKVFAKLKELARQRATRRSCSSENCEDSDDEAETEEEPLCHLPLTPTEGSETDSDSMKDFIVEEEEDDDDDTEHIKSENQAQQKELNTSNSEFLAYYVPHLSRCDHYVHFKRIVKAFLINAIDDTFLSSLYEGTRQKKYAQDMLLSLHYLDDRFIQPRLENLISRSRWKDRYKERVDCYPDIRIILKNPKNMFCQACELNRYCKFNVLLSGRLYNSRTLEADDFMSDDKQVLKVGTVCANRTRVYHNLKHFKYKLYMDCSSVTELDGVEDEPVKDTVERLFSQLEDSGWIQKRYNDLEDYMNDADSFQEEKMD
ncbi:coiled-coil domain-containing protein 82 isoform X2 [Aquila chrysaetos chrysaetos]|uniref:Coiled-coil domain containing 82 n=2 Tax=Aquila chrysaetos chrysaetos TaxID=223781 RepID=A0A663EL58_AQUCH|nr:coiled-coil domain-containing protein 82 isoform X2 [Aquila chrysaetos chrysaetos]XP_029898197.1 coiled-coil domain-containing protein 82 isoform X2 [Aquila chrysaetos chrysaetos]XP_029898199.1 coiled-coil domain-containing protein 82 isoform X2 [Aquila chrysaetos chrysaetos]XP_029898200.1 coiled-coil domain-containing protein 82 isoform X2 [Aquila chrysaetos chrysaetos]XP_029898201.1 coiled-coil domain-containing protein 82 isoform X2 [Aquila chrysaetos chrysaetos]